MPVLHRLINPRCPCRLKSLKHRLQGLLLSRPYNTMIFLRVAAEMRLKGRHGIDVNLVEHLANRKSILFDGVDNNLPIIIYDALKDARYCHDALVVRLPSARFFIGVPIMLSRKTCFGILCLMDTKPRTFYSLHDCRFAMQAAE